MMTSIETQGGTSTVTKQYKNREKKGEPMKTLINYLRSCFHKHEWELVDKVSWGSDQIHTKWTYHCKKCCYFKKYIN